MHVFIQSTLNFHTKKIVRSDFIIFSDMVLNVYETKWDYVQFFSALNFKLREHFFLHVALLELFCYDIVMFQEGCEAIVLFNIHGEFYYIVMSIDDLKTGIFLVYAKVLWFFVCCVSNDLLPAFLLLFVSLFWMRIKLLPFGLRNVSFGKWGDFKERWQFYWILWVVRL